MDDRRLKRLTRESEGLDGRIAVLAELTAETHKRQRDALAGALASSVAFAVVLATGVLTDTLPEVIVANLGAVLLNLFLSLKAFSEAYQDRCTHRVRESDLVRDYKNTLWELDRFERGILSATYSYENASTTTQSQHLYINTNT